MSLINEILQEAMRLPEDQRFTLAHKLLTISEPHLSDDVTTAWDVEIRNRIERHDRGKTHSHTASEVFRDIDDHLS